MQLQPFESQKINFWLSWAAAACFFLLKVNFALRHIRLLVFTILRHITKPPDCEVTVTTKGTYCKTINILKWMSNLCARTL